MLWKYAPAADMVGDRAVDGLYGASGRYLQMGRRRRSGSLLRSVLAGCRKDRYVSTQPCRIGRITQRYSGCPLGASAACAGRSQLHRILDHFAVAGADLFRRGCCGRALESQPAASAQSIHHLAFERQAAGLPAECRFVCSAAPGSRHICACRHDHRSADERIADQQQRDFLRASALGAVAAVASEKIAPSVARPEARLVG